MSLQQRKKPLGTQTTVTSSHQTSSHQTCCIRTWDHRGEILPAAVKAMWSQDCRAPKHLQSLESLAQFLPLVQTLPCSTCRHRGQPQRRAGPEALAMGRDGRGTAGAVPSCRAAVPHLPPSEGAGKSMRHPRATGMPHPPLHTLTSFSSTFMASHCR